MVLQLKIIIIKMKKFTRGNERQMNRQKRESVNFKTVQWIWSSLKNRKKKRLKKSRTRDLWDMDKETTTICIVGIPGEEREKGAQKIFKEMMDENFPNLMKGMNINIQEDQWIPNKMNSERPPRRYIISKLPKNKESEKQQERSKFLHTTDP